MGLWILIQSLAYFAALGFLSALLLIITAAVLAYIASFTEVLLRNIRRKVK